MRSSFVSRIKKTLRFIGLVAICFLLFANAHEYLRHHFFNLIQAAWSLFIQKEGTTTPGFASNIAWPLISIAVAWYLIRKERGKGAAEVHFREEAKLAMRVIVIVAILIYGPMAIWCVVRAVYDDHHNMASRWQAVVNEKENLRNELKQRDEYIQRLKAISCPTCPADRQSRSQQASVPETIHDVLAEVRITCDLKNPSHIPDDVMEAAEPLDSYLEGTRGKAYLEFGRAYYKRAEEEGKAIAIEDFRLPPKSDLVGNPVSSILGYSLFHIEDRAVAGGIFSRCTFVEVTLRINGRDVFRHAESAVYTLGPTTGWKFDMHLIGMKAP